MTALHLISLIAANCNNLDDLKKIHTAVEAYIELAELELALKEFSEQADIVPQTLKQIQAQNQ